MAKISPTSIKYSIVADFEAEGPLQKPDVIGALFGQTEGLLGSDMELRELQKEGKIGRIEVDLKNESGRTVGEIILPSALDKTETTIIAASLETIDKIGPTDAKITVRSIDDVRGSKRDYIMERAKALLANIQNEGKDSSEMGTELRESTRVAKVVEYGEERLAAGPDLDDNNEIIVVEGRADVVNMLRHGINNVIGMNGTRLPKTIAKLGEEKELTLFVDGDRGGLLIATNVCDNAKVVYIAQAPDGKEVEELTSKELRMALRKKVSTKDFFRQTGRVASSAETNVSVERRALTSDDKKKLREMQDDLLKGRNVAVLDENLGVIDIVPASKLNYLKTNDAFILVADSVTGTILSGAERLNVKAIAAKNFGSRMPETDLELISL
jgi:DNA primase